tara:strand:- start:4521 stop:5267 length:747 start_codon:yes stop_codon:yes gene_type:complete
MIKIPSKKSKKFLKNYFEEMKIKNFLIDDKRSFSPDLEDLYFIHKLILTNKRITALEFGCGWSTLIIKHALIINRKKFLSKTKMLRKNNLFELHTVDNQKKYLKLTKNKTRKFFANKEKIYYHYSKCKMSKFNGRICTEYEYLPLINPDFIYLDGPNPFSVSGNISNFSTAHKELMPMASDILKIEPFLLPGTIILIDGRTANASFLKNNFQRNWLYRRIEKTDHSIFYLKDKPLGELNKKQLKFYQN